MVCDVPLCGQYFGYKVFFYFEPGRWYLIIWIWDNFLAQKLYDIKRVTFTFRSTTNCRHFHLSTMRSKFFTKKLLEHYLLLFLDLKRLVFHFKCEKVDYYLIWFGVIALLFILYCIFVSGYWRSLLSREYLFSFCWQVHWHVHSYFLIDHNIDHR